MPVFTCIKCNEKKDISLFYKEDSKRGHTNKCMNCLKKIRKEYRDNNKIKIQKANKKRRIQKTIEARKSRDKNRCSINIKQRENYKKNREKYILASRESRSKYPEKEKAHNIIRGLIRSGKIIRPSICSACNKTCKPQAHHEDYSKPYEIIWLCRSCHMKHHKGVFEKGNIPLRETE